VTVSPGANSPGPTTGHGGGLWQSVPMDGTLIIGAFGLVTTALAGPLNNTQSSRSEHKKWLREQRSQALTNAVSYAQHLYSRIQYLDEPYMTQTTGGVQLVHADLIAARLLLTCGPRLLDAWIAMRLAEDWMFEDLRNNYPAPDSHLPEGYENLKETRQRVEHFLALAKDEFGL
jgi:hypothetical protein